MGHLSPVCDSSRMIARRASLRDARRKINFRTAGRNYPAKFQKFAERSAASRSFESLGAECGGSAGPRVSPGWRHGGRITFLVVIHLLCKHHRTGVALLGLSQGRLTAPGDFLRKICLTSWIDAAPRVPPPGGRRSTPKATALDHPSSAARLRSVWSGDKDSRSLFTTARLT